MILLFPQIFETIGIRDLLRDFIYHKSWRTTAQSQWQEKSPNWNNGLVGTTVVTTVENPTRGIPGGMRTVLTYAVFRPRATWENAVNAKLTGTNARTLCAGEDNKGGPFQMGILDFASTACVRLLSNMITWTVLQNADQFDFSWDPAADIQH